ncbi:hypothetical protein BU26DRAFT_61535 [Trematosphaeria pertusa]|uniref:Uncharacterized protein n=1 Tax=Trematosphaeria pertusa TaxID=390896 RepID=A0A6A6I981_9PLEO|nr:uncharacterized protein BU26DRAFT_61535 [Trematosphaeria pertusa]KAF2246070.1 hypothetical protein BU26DRAFT_61535 [Trematosphaeria pertusa]
MLGVAPRKSLYGTTHFPFPMERASEFNAKEPQFSLKSCSSVRTTNYTPQECWSGLPSTGPDCPTFNMNPTRPFVSSLAPPVGSEPLPSSSGQGY